MPRCSWPSIAAMLLIPSTLSDIEANRDLAVDTELLDYYCTDNEQSAGRLVGQ